MAIKVVPKEQMLDAIGTKFEPGPWVEVTQDRINTFADCTDDHQFIHVDAEAAKNTPFGTTIAHGFLTLSLLPLLSAQGRPTYQVVGHGNAVNYGSDKLRFRNPVTPGDQLILEAKFISCKRQIWKFECQASVDGKPVCSAEIICAERKL